MGTTAPVPWLMQVLRLLPGPIRSALDHWSHRLAQRKAAQRAVGAAGKQPVQPPAQAAPEPRYPSWNE